MISVYALQCGLDDRRLDLDNDHVGSNPENYEDKHGGYGYGVGNKEGKRILDFCVAMNMTVGNTLFKKKGKSPSHLCICSIKNSG